MAQACSAGNEKTWLALVAEFPPEDYAAVSAAVAVLASTTRGRRRDRSPWRPDDEYTSQVLSDIKYQRPHRSISPRQ